MIKYWWKIIIRLYQKIGFRQFYLLLFAQVVSRCQLSRAGTCPRDSLASLSFSVAVFLKERAVDHVSFVLTPRALLGNLKFTARYQQIKQHQRLQVMFYALNELSLIVSAKNCISVFYISCSGVYINALYKLVWLSIILPACFSFERSPLAMQR